MTPQVDARRHVGIDAVRYVGAGFVVLLHSLPASRSGASPLVGVIDLASRFAVPFFFMASGYFLQRQKHPPFVAIRASVLRIVPVYLVWLAVYLLCFPELRPADTSPRGIVVTLLTGGSVFHLWFLPALLVASSAQLMLRACTGPCVQATLAAVLLLLGLLLGSYRGLIGLGQPGRAGLLVAYPLLMAGYLAASYRWRCTAVAAVAILCVGLCAEVVESSMLKQLNAGEFGTQNFLLGTVVFSYGIFQLALALPKHPLTTLLAAGGRMSLGVYCCHLIFVLLAYRHWPPDTPGRSIVVAVLAFASATAMAVALSRVRPLRRMVT